MEKRKQHASAGALANFLTVVEEGQEDQRGSCLAESIERILEGQRLHDLPDAIQQLATLDIKVNEIYADMGYLLAAKYSILKRLEKQMQAPDASQEDKNAVILAAIPYVINDLRKIQNILAQITQGDINTDSEVYIPDQGYEKLALVLPQLVQHLLEVIATLKG